VLNDLSNCCWNRLNEMLTHCYIPSIEKLSGDGVVCYRECPELVCHLLCASIDAGSVSEGIRLFLMTLLMIDSQHK